MVLLRNRSADAACGPSNPSLDMIQLVKPMPIPAAMHVRSWLWIHQEQASHCYKAQDTGTAADE